jgi:hypothetical protein
MPGKTAAYFVKTRISKIVKKTDSELIQGLKISSDSLLKLKNTKQFIRIKAKDN